MPILWSFDCAPAASRSSYSAEDDNFDESASDVYTQLRLM